MGARFVPVALIALALMIQHAARAPARTTPGGEGGKVVILVVDRVGAADFPSDATPFCRALAERWSIGLVATRSGGKEKVGPLETGGEYITLGAGVRARGGDDAELCLNALERFGTRGGYSTAGEFYREHTGRSSPETAVICLGWQNVLRNNRSSNKEENAGLMGELLRGDSRKPAVLGNQDTYGVPRRLAPLICCDSTGLVPLGDVGERMDRRAPRSAGGCQTDIDRIVGEARRLLGTSDLLVIDTGDTGRVDRAYSYTSDDFLEAARQRALARVDTIAREICGSLDLERSLLLIVTPGAPTQARAEGNFLVPCIAAGHGFGRGLLTSSSTRRPGLLSGADVLPTVLEFYGISVPSSVVGAPMKTVKASGTLEYVLRLSNQLDATRKARAPLVIAYYCLLVLEALLFGLFLLSANGRFPWPRKPERAARFLAPSLVVFMAAPLSFLLAGAFYYSSTVYPLMFCVLFSLLLGLLAYRAYRDNRRFDPIVAVLLLTTAVGLVDLFAGGRLLMFPLLGSSSPEGARFFGISNAVAGILLASAVWAVAGLSGRKDPGRRGRALELGFLVLVSFVIGFGALGANVGAFIAGLAVALLYFEALASRPMTWLRSLAVALATIAGTAVVVLLDTLLFRTHATKAAQGGASRIIPIIGTKVAIQVGQIRTVLVPAVIMMALVVAVAVWMKRPGSIWAERWASDRGRTAAIYSLAIGGLVALTFNDTGIAMMGCMFQVSAIAFMYYVATGAIPWARSSGQGAATPGG